VRLISELIIPACEGRAFEVAKGQTLRIHQIDGGQVGDCVFYNYRESFHTGASWGLNKNLGTGTSKAYKHFIPRRRGKTPC